ncbi:hypothetical protein ACFSGX_03925 [Sphingomonas arantia]|uniref:Uncharacterized protein n=1 Tax=Sphingomonas arantia TaxID=1460676 RepID=A0ABW4TW54_9SPHN
MPDQDQSQTTAELRLRALSRWDDEGGAIATPQPLHADVAPFTHAEIVQLRIRAIAVENLLIAVLAEGTDRQRQVARDMAAYIAPRSGFTHHPLTIDAGQHMTSLIERAEHYRTIAS